MGRQAIRSEGVKTGYERAFVALVPDIAAQTRLVSYSASCSAFFTTADLNITTPSDKQNIQAYAPEDLHMTLAFLGGVNVSQVCAILAALPSIACPLPTLTCIGETWWPNRQKPRVHVIRYGLPSALQAIHAKVQDLVTTLGIPIDSRPYRPHITLSRVRMRQPVRLPHAAMTLSDATTLRSTLNARMIHIGLFCKNTEGGRLRYRVLGQFPLGNVPI